MSSLTTDPTPREALQRAGFLDRMPDLRLPSAPPIGVRRLVLWLLLLGVGLVGGLGSWAALAPMTSAVVASGAFRVVGDRLVVQHLEGGLLRRIEVSEGALVEQGAVIAVLDDTRSQAQIAILSSQLASALAQEARLAAEHVGAAELRQPEELAALIAADPELAPLWQAQRDIFFSNRAMLDGQVQILRERIAQLGERVAGFELRRVGLQTQLDLVREELGGLEKLHEQGLVTMARLTQRRQDEALILSDFGLVDSDRLSARQQVAEMEERILQIRRDWLREIADQRQRLHETVFDLRQRLAATHEVLERLTIRAPRTGRVVNLGINTLGGVIQPGQNLLEIVPRDADFVVETRVSPSDIDEVDLGGPARVQLSAYSFRSTPALAGTVVQVSADSLVDPATSEPYFQVDVAVSPEALAALPHIRTLPGMPAQVMLETGEQTLLDYLVNPVLSGMSTALLERE